MEEQKKIHALCISGGGAWGACGAGTLAAWNKQYDIVSGVSTGALMAPLVALQKWDRLREGYTSVGQSDIFNYNPFLSNGKINPLKALWRIIRGKSTLGESDALRKTIDRFFTEDDFYELKNLNKEIIVACQEVSYDPEKVHYFSSADYTYKDFGDWMFGSANAPLVCSLLRKKIHANDDQVREWTDAGVSELLSLRKLLLTGATDIDVIIHRPKPYSAGGPDYPKGFTKDIFHNAARMLSILRHEVEKGDLVLGLEIAKATKRNIRVCYLPEKLSSNALMFDQKAMNAWYEYGFNTAFSPDRIFEYDYRT